MAGEIEPEIKHVIFDFDRTISAHHIHGNLTNVMIPAYQAIHYPEGVEKFLASLQGEDKDKEYPFTRGRVSGQGNIQTWTPEEIALMWNFINGPVYPSDPGGPQFNEVTGSIEQWGAIFINLIDQGYKVSIASFTSYGPIVEKFLSDVIRLPPDYMAKITFETWLPTEDKLDTKNPHLDRILDVQSDDERAKKYSEALFFDDTVQNVTKMNGAIGADSRNGVALVPGSPLNANEIAKVLNSRLGLTIPSEVATPLSGEYTEFTRTTTTPSTTALMQQSLGFQEHTKKIQVGPNTIDYPQNNNSQDVAKAVVKDIGAQLKNNSSFTVNIPKGVQPDLAFEVKRDLPNYIISFKQITDSTLALKIYQELETKVGSNNLTINIRELDFQNINIYNLRHFISQFDTKTTRAMLDTLTTKQLELLQNRFNNYEYVAKEAGKILTERQQALVTFTQAIGQEKWDSLVEIKYPKTSHEKKEQALYELKKSVLEIQKQADQGKSGADSRLNTQLKKAIVAAINFQESKFLGKVGLTQSDTAHDLIALYQKRGGNAEELKQGLRDNGIKDKSIEKYLPEQTQKKAISRSAS